MTTHVKAIDTFPFPLTFNVIMVSEDPHLQESSNSDVLRFLLTLRSSPGQSSPPYLYQFHIKYTKINSKPCIQGHRSSSCNHTDRPLFEVKKKGRPVSQCEMCRELRHSRRIHSKYACTHGKDDNPSNSKPSSSKSTRIRSSGNNILILPSSSSPITSHRSCVTPWLQRSSLPFPINTISYGTERKRSSRSRSCRGRRL